MCEACWYSVDKHMDNLEITVEQEGEKTAFFPLTTLSTPFSHTGISGFSTPSSETTSPNNQEIQGSIELSRYQQQ